MVSECFPDFVHVDGIRIRYPHNKMRRTGVHEDGSAYGSGDQDSAEWVLPGNLMDLS